MKKTAIWMFAVVALLIMGAVSVSAATYKAQGKCGDQANWTLDNEGNFRVYGKGEMYEFTTDRFSFSLNGKEREWEKYINEIRTVTVENGITTVGECSFEGCANLKSVSLPSTLTGIGDWAFWECKSLSQINFPKSLQDIGAWTFVNTGFTTLVYPAAVKVSGIEMFKDCKRLVSVEFNWGYGVLPDKMFAGCTNLKKVTLGENIWVIDRNAFEDCSSLEEIVIPRKVVGMVKGVFKGCTSLKKVHFRGEAPKISENVFEGYDLFEGCGEITAYYPANSKTWNSSNMLNYGAKKITWVKEGNIASDSVSKVTPVLKSVSNGATSLSVKWDKVANATGYQIYRQENSGSWKRVATIKSGSTVSYTDTKVVNGRRYGYRVFATKGSERSKVSKTIYKYFIARNTVTLAKTKSYINIKWKTNSTATGYQVQYAKNSKFSEAKTIKIASRGTSSKNMKPGFRGNCYVRVRTYKTVSGVTYYSAWSTTKRITF